MSTYSSHVRETQNINRVELHYALCNPKNSLMIFYRKMIELLPDDCLSHILSLTSPQDVSKVCVISSTARSMANSDTIWEKFLPPHHQEILSTLVAPLIYSSKKDLFLHLSNPHLIDEGNKVISNIPNFKINFRGCIIKPASSTCLKCTQLMN